MHCCHSKHTFVVIDWLLVEKNRKHIHYDVKLKLLKMYIYHLILLLAYSNLIFILQFEKIVFWRNEKTLLLALFDGVPVQQGVLLIRPSRPHGCLRSRSGPCGGTLAVTRSVGCTDQSRMGAASQELVEMGCNNRHTCCYSVKVTIFNNDYLT